jgi:S-adenosylmethionine synthetase
MSDTNNTIARTYTSESVTEGHPDKVADLIADTLLDSWLRWDPQARVAVEVLVKGLHVVLAGEVTARHLDHTKVEELVRQTIRDLDYTRAFELFYTSKVKVTDLITPQSPEIASMVRTRRGKIGAGDQGLMFGYATDETPEGLPLPVVLSHRLARFLVADRKTGHCPWLRPDGKAQVSVVYEDDRPVRVDTVVVSAQHDQNVELETVRDYIRDDLVPRALGEWHHDDLTIHANPGGTFSFGGPDADAGVTGRKIMVDTYGGLARHGGGAFSGKDASKVDRSGAYAARQAALTLVRSGLAKRAEVQLAYAIGQTAPLSIAVDTFGTGDDQACQDLLETFDFSPDAIIERLRLTEPRFASVTNYGHFGRPELPWEQPLNAVTEEEVQS